MGRDRNTKQSRTIRKPPFSLDLNSNDPEVVKNNFRKIQAYLEAGVTRVRKEAFDAWDPVFMSSYTPGSSPVEEKPGKAREFSRRTGTVLIGGVAAWECGSAAESSDPDYVAGQIFYDGHIEGIGGSVPYFNHSYGAVGAFLERPVLVLSPFTDTRASPGNWNQNVSPTVMAHWYDLAESPGPDLDTIRAYVIYTDNGPVPWSATNKYFGVSWMAFGKVRS